MSCGQPVCVVVHFLFGGYQWGRSHTGWPHTAQSGEPNCQGPEASLDSEIRTPNNPHFLLTLLQASPTGVNHQS